MTDVLIIGGGIAGLSAAAYLAPHAQVTLLEAEPQVGYHASGRSAAIFLEHYGNAVVRQLNSASLRDLRAIPGLLSEKRMLLVGRADETERFRINAKDYDLQVISVGEATALWPILNPQTVAHTATRTDIYDLDTDMILQHMRRQAIAAGAVIETGARVTELAPGPRWTVQAGARDWTADIIVNAAGAWADQVATLAGVRPLGIQPYRRSMARIPAPDGMDTSDWPFVDGVDDRFYSKPDAGAVLVSPADEDPLPPQDAWADDMVLAQGLADYEEMSTQPVTRMLANWAGLRSFAPDRALVIGRDSGTPGFFWLAGQGGYGFQTCCAAAQLTADLLTGRAPDLDAATIAALDPGRFNAR